MKLPDAEQLCQQLARELAPRVAPRTAMIGIHTGGAWLEGDGERWDLVRWSEEPVGGEQLEDHSAHDVTGG